MVLMICYVLDMLLLECTPLHHIAAQILNGFSILCSKDIFPIEHPHPPTDHIHFLESTAIDRSGPLHYGSMDPAMIHQRASGGKPCEARVGKISVPPDLEPWSKALLCQG